jgi:hypothetical protein
VTGVRAPAFERTELKQSASGRQAGYRTLCANARAPAGLTFSGRSAPFGTALSMVVAAKVHQIVQSGI